MGGEREALAKIYIRRTTKQTRSSGYVRKSTRVWNSQELKHASVSRKFVTSLQTMAARHVRSWLLEDSHKKCGEFSRTPSLDSTLDFQARWARGGAGTRRFLSIMRTLATATGCR